MSTAKPLRVTVVLRWNVLGDPDDRRWKRRGTLCARYAPTTGRMLYIAHTDRATVRHKMLGEGFDDQAFERLVNDPEYNDCEGYVCAIARAPRKPVGLLYYCESLLGGTLCPITYATDPETRIRLPGLRVKCTGDWPLQRTVFVEE